MTYLKPLHPLLPLMQCPQCGSHLKDEENQWKCAGGHTFGLVAIDREALQPDLRVYSHDSQRHSQWEHGYVEFDNYTQFYRRRNDLKFYLTEIANQREAYTQQFSVAGSVLDIGGGWGYLRHFLDPGQTELYVNLDPYPEMFSLFPEDHSLFKAYPAVRRPMHLAIGMGEHIPFRESTFDWVHIRSALDHVYDAQRTVAEAARVLKPGGRLLVGNYIKKGYLGGEREKLTLPQKARNKLVKWWRRTFLSHTWYHVADDDHMYDFSAAEIAAMLVEAGLEIEKEFWLSPAWKRWYYVSGRKP